MLLEMLFYVFQNNEEQIYVLFFIHYIERWCFYHRDVHHEQWFLFFRIRDFEFIKIESEIFNHFRIFNFIDWFYRFFVFSKKINRWLIRIMFFSRKTFDDDRKRFFRVLCRIVKRFVRVLSRIVKFEVIWFIQKRFLFEMNVFFCSSSLSFSTACRTQNKIRWCSFFHDNWRRVYAFMIYLVLMFAALAWWST